MRFAEIQSLKLRYKMDNPIPYRLDLTRVDGSLVQSGGWSWAESAINLLATASLGRPDDLNIAEILYVAWNKTNIPEVQKLASLASEETRGICEKYDYNRRAKTAHK